MSRSGARVIGLLPVAGPLAAAAPLAPFLSRLGLALSGFVAGDVALIDGWRSWGSPSGADGEALPEMEEDAGGVARQPPAGTSRFREVHPHVLEVTPPPCADAATAALALQNTVGVLRRGVALVLIHLGGYAGPGVAPAPLILVDGVVMLVPRRRTLRARVADLLDHVTPAKRLGAILVG